MKSESLKRLGKLVILMSLVGAFFCNQDVSFSQTSPKTYYVAKNGRDTNPGTISAPFLTIKQCVRVVVAGETCLVRAGNYNERFIHIGIGYTATGTSWSNPITLKSYPGEFVSIEDIAEDSIMVFHGSATSDLYWVIDGFVFDGSSGWRCCQGGGGLVGGDGRSVRIQNCEIKYGASHGILAGGSNWELLNLNVHDNGAQPSNPPGHGIYWAGTRLLIDGGYYHDNYGFGIHIFDSGSISVNDNTVRNTKVYGNNRLSGGAGVILSAGFNNSAYNNVIYNNVGDGLDIDYRCNNCSAYNNTIYNNSSWGMQIGFNHSAANTIVENNIVYGNLNPIRDRGTNTFATNNMITNPLFLNPSTGDFSLQSSSGAIRAGVNLSSIFTTDISNKPRQASGPWDLGAYSYVPPPSMPSTLKAAFVGTPGQDYVGPGNQLTGNGHADWNIHLQGMRSTPIRVHITSAAGGIWEDIFTGAYWILLLQADRSGNGDLWFEPFGANAGFHVKVWYADGTTDEVDAGDGAITPLTLQASFLGVTGEDIVGPIQVASSGIPDWHIRLQGLRSSPIKVRITSSPDGVWENPLNGSNWNILTRQDGSGNADLFYEPWKNPNGFHVKVWYADGTTAEVDAAAGAIVPATLQASLFGVTGEDIVGPVLLNANGTKDWHIRLQGLRSSPVKVQITSSPGGVWETPFNGANWIVNSRPDGSANADLFYEPWNNPAGFHVKVWYSDGTTAEVDAH